MNGAGYRTPLRMAVLAAATVGLAAGCANRTSLHGQIVEDARLAQLEVGTATQEDVLFTLGTPTTTAPFDDATWYYIGQVTEQRAFLEPKVVDRRVVVLTFDDSGRLVEVGDLTLEDGQEVALVDRETPTLGRQFTFVEQMIGNLGRLGSIGESGNSGVNTPGGGL